jgi:hypothetical protein
MFGSQRKTGPDAGTRTIVHVRITSEFASSRVWKTVRNAIHVAHVGRSESDIMKTPITVRIEARLLAEARQCAREENRSLTNFIETLFRERIAASHRTASPCARDNADQETRANG